MSGIWVDENRSQGRNQIQWILAASLNSPTVFMKQNGDSFKNQL